MKPSLKPPPDEPSEADLKRAAYLIWIDSGRPSGSHAAHWLAAREMLSHRHDPAPVPTNGPGVSDPTANAISGLPPPGADGRTVVAPCPCRRRRSRPARGATESAPATV